MKPLFKKGLSAVLAAALTVSMAATAFATPNAEDTVITVLHTNDVHGAVVSDDSHAGLDYLAGMKNAMKANGQNVLLVDAGDYSQGTPFVADSKGQSAIKIMNEVGYDAAALGNHEFDYSLDEISANIKAAKFDILNANIEDPEEIIPGLSDLNKAKVVNFNGVKVGIFALNTPETFELSQPAKVGKLNFHGNDLSQFAQETVNNLRNTEGCDVVIALCHLGESSAKWSSRELAQNVTGIDLIVDGHDHVERMGNAGDYASSNKGAIKINNSTNETTIVSTGTALNYVGKVTITVKQSGDVEVKSEGIPNADLKSSYTPDPTVKTVADAVAKEVNEKYAEVIGKTKIGLYAGTPICRRAESNMADLVADANRWRTLQWQKTAPDELKNLPVIGYTGGGGVRASIPAGDITKKDIITVLPFGGETRYLKMSHKALWEMVENGVSLISVNTPEVDTKNTGEIYGNKGRFFIPSGMKYVYDPTKTPTVSDEKRMGNRVQSITLDDGTAIDKNATDKFVLVMTGSYEVGGGDGYYMCDPAYYGDGQVTVVGADTSNDVFLTDYIKYLLTLPENKDGLCVLSETGRIKAINTGYTATSYAATVNLLDKDGNPAAGAWAKVEIDGKEFGEYVADENGVITVPGIGNGLHDLCAIAADGSRAADYVSDYAGQKSIELKANFTVVEQKPSDPGQPDDTTPDDNKEKGDSVNTGDSAGSLIAFSALAISGLAALSLKKRKH
ncbi:bifunctional metallophosphatase/5'-nucleotidase [Bittarella massiliensis (ex Durand et al. 2017)]|uniref:bifunctional metallophosphatase/5'-nucleotidase n=1 Tax=Bittarella massiliensis (ex Durand et al. 2017) TaxID=1720313 RepID=UPI001AA1B538|nr:bifunctional UDP-sugar hydrolase/5'-nucleotidase [Bittarella massiliensis (ex Durand et al. 2017)]MBO1680075.1 bifunctional metallophosphatase/5'-nucleotidase [Bittarella massiliensis (ex Durand et al. 2017)]